MARPEDKRILIVDDEPDVVAYFSAILENAGFQVATASEGAEALERVRERKPDLISLDLVMPRKSGIRFLYELRKNREWSKIPVLIVTAHARDDMGKADFDEIFSGRTLSGPAMYLEKPVNPDSFLHSVLKVLGLPVPKDGKPGPADNGERIRGEIDSRLKDANPDTLKRVLRELRGDPGE